MKIINLKLKNFMGIRNLELNFNGKNASIYGTNATGKTTCFSAFTWLLFDKDSQNKKDFEIKTLGPDGEPEHGLEHTVEAELELENGKRLTLKKVYSEKWTKKRGSATKEFTGHTTDYFIDGVPVKKGEYEARIAEITDENIFKLLTNPTYFNEQLHWQNRRKILLEVCGDISDEEVIASNKALARLPEILQGRKLEDHRKVVMARRTEINKELEKIPVRIDEVQRNLPDISNMEIPQTEKLFEDISKLKNKLQEKTHELAQIENGNIIAQKTRQLLELESEILKLQNQYHTKYEELIRTKQKALDITQEEYHDLLAFIKRMEKEAELNKEELVSLEDKIVALRAKWHETNAQEFAQSDTCPTCGQPLPSEKIEKARANFNRTKAEQLEAITAEGKQLKQKANELTDKINKIENNISKAKKQLSEIEKSITCGQKDIENLKQQAEFATANDRRFTEIYSRKLNLENEIKQLKESNMEAVQKIQKEMTAIEQDISILEETKSKIERYKEGQKRIEELKQQEKQLAAEFEKLEGELYLTEQFIRTKVNLLEGKINSRFKLARFKLFDQQINGGVVECCETLYNGVPYSGGLNNAARINVGLDIINTLSEHYGFEAPIFIDNREAVTKLIETKSQVISLIVSEPDKKLRVEVM